MPRHDDDQAPQHQAPYDPRQAPPDQVPSAPVMDWTAARIVSPRTARMSPYVAALALLLAGIATVGFGSPASSSAGSRDDERASRNEIRVAASVAPSTTAPTSTAPTSTAPSTAPPASAPPTAEPAPTVVATTAPTTAPAPATKKATPKAAAPPVASAGCSGYAGNRLVACNLLPSFGFDTSEMSALDPLWEHESGWDSTAENSSGAYGIPQALPGSKMSVAGSDWRTNPATQIRWGLGYIKDRYGSPSAAWSSWQANGWY